MRLRTLLPLGIALFIALPITQASALAQSPVKEHFVDEGIFLLPDVDCGSFSLHEDLVSEDVLQRRQPGKGRDTGEPRRRDP
jgi:hypothetical protein